MDLRNRQQQEELPLHYEGLRLRPGLRALGWCAALAGFGFGIGLMVRLPDTVAELLGALLGAGAALLVFVLVRLASFELVVGRRWLQAGGGPLVRRLPREAIADPRIAVASSWRRAFAPTQVELVVGDRTVVVPSAEPEALVRALAEPVAE